MKLSKVQIAALEKMKDGRVLRSGRGVSSTTITALEKRGLVKVDWTDSYNEFTATLLPSTEKHTSLSERSLVALRTALTNEQGIIEGTTSVKETLRKEGYARWDAYANREGHWGFMVITAEGRKALGEVSS